MSNQSLNAHKLAFSFAFIWALTMLALGWLGWLFGYAINFIHVMGSLYIGFQANFIGGIWGAVWGFIDFYIAIWLVTVLYNKLLGANQ